MVRTIALDHDRKRDAILKVAVKVFADHGFDRASMSQIAKQCGISKAAIYHYYDGKDALLYDVLDRHMKNLVSSVAKLEMPDGSPEQHLYEVVLAILLVYHGADDQHRAQVTAANALSKKNRELLLEQQRELVRLVSGAIAAIRPEKFRQDPELLHAVTMSLFGSLNWFYMWNSRKGVQPRKKYARIACDLMLNGLKQM